MVSYALEKFSNGEKKSSLLLMPLIFDFADSEEKTHMERFDVKASTTMLGPKCPQLLGLHSVSGCDTNGYFFRKGEVNALRLLWNNDYTHVPQLLRY